MSKKCNCFGKSKKMNRKQQKKKQAQQIFSYQTFEI